MSEEKFDCIIVGGGVAGLTAAYVLAGEGMEVLLVEKGNYSGAKNMTGGRLYGHSLEKVIPDFAENAPLERKIVIDRLSVGSGEGINTVEYSSAGFAAPEGDSYAVLRGQFDRWFADQAEEQGAMLVYGVLVDALLVEDGKVYGIVAGDEEMEADVVILADGANSLLAQKLGERDTLSPDRATVGVKDVIGLSEEIINQRFNVASGEGVAWLFSGVGDAYDGFIYTNKDSVSVGINMLVSNIDKTENNVPQMLEDFKNLPQIAPLLEGGRLMEYSAHLIPEGEAKALPKLYGDGLLLTGDSAELCVNLGFTLRGMDLAIESGRLAAQAVIEAKEKGDFSAQTLSSYQKALENSFVMDCIKGAEACQAVVNAGGFSDDPLGAFNGVMQKMNIR